MDLEVSWSSTVTGADMSLSCLPPQVLQIMTHPSPYMSRWYDFWGMCCGSTSSLDNLSLELNHMKRVMIHHGISGRKPAAVNSDGLGNASTAPTRLNSHVDGTSQTCPFEMAAASGVPCPVGNDAFLAEQMRRNLYQFAAKQHTLSKDIKAMDNRMAVMMAHGTVTGKATETLYAVFTNNVVCWVCNHEACKGIETLPPKN